MRAEDILPGNQDFLESNGVPIRKGTVAAFLSNANAWIDPATDAVEKQVAERDMIDSLPTMRAWGVFEIFSIQNAALRQLIETH